MKANMKISHQVMRVGYHEDDMIAEFDTEPEAIAKIEDTNAGIMGTVTFYIRKVWKNTN